MIHEEGIHVQESLQTRSTKTGSQISSTFKYEKMHVSKGSMLPYLNQEAGFKRKLDQGN